MAVALDLHLVYWRFCLLEGGLFLFLDWLLPADSAIYEDDDALVAMLIDLGPQVLVTHSLSILPLLQLCIRNHQFGSNVDGPVESHANLHFLRRRGDAFTGVHCE